MIRNIRARKVNKIFLAALPIFLLSGCIYGTNNFPIPVNQRVKLLPDGYIKVCEGSNKCYNSYVSFNRASRYASLTVNNKNYNISSIKIGSNNYLMYVKSSNTLDNNTIMFGHFDDRVLHTQVMKCKYDVASAISSIYRNDKKCVFSSTNQAIRYYNNMSRNSPSMFTSSFYIYN